MSRTGDRLDRIEQALVRAADELAALRRDHAEALSRVGGTVAALAETVQQVMASRAEHDGKVAADAKAARSAAESAFVATQALAAVATGPQPVLPPGAAAPAPPAGGPGTAGRKPKASGM